MMPRVSVIIPLYNLRAFVAEAIESVRAQTLPAADVELVVVDDGSTDDGAAIVARYAPSVRYLRQENRGLSAARNAGIRATQAPVLTFLDADDRILPEKLGMQLDVLAASPGIGAVYTGYGYIDAAGAPLPERGSPRQEGDLLPALLLGNLVPPHAVMVRRALVEHAGGFDETLTSVEDWDLWLRISRHGCRWACVDRPLAEYRVRPDAMHQNPGRMAANTIRVLDKFFADPTLPPDIGERRPLAYQQAYATAAADHYRVGDRVAAREWFRRAATVRPAFVADTRSLRRFCRALLPPESQSGGAVAATWRPTAATLRAALRDLFAAPDLDPAVRRLRWRAELAYWRTIARLVRKRAAAAVP
jgi:hypothetical protein